MVLSRPIRPKLTPQKTCPFHYRGLECKSRKSRDTWSNRQIWPWSTKQSRSKAKRVLPREHTGHSKHALPATQEKTLHMDITQYWSQIFFVLCNQRWRSSIQSPKTRPRADCDPDHELLIAKFSLKLKKVGKTTRHSVEFSSVQSLSRVRLCNPMDCSMPGLSVHHQLLEFMQTHVHWVGDAIQPSHSLSSSSPPAFNLSQHQGLFKDHSGMT